MAGVLGSTKLYKPSAIEATPVMINGRLLSEILPNPSSGGSIKPTTRPEAIQPKVPSTRMRGNSFSVSVMLAKAMLLVSATVGI
ncbi:hypothetical protein D3C75_841410 [compost metagenome]